MQPLSDRQSPHARTGRSCGRMATLALVAALPASLFVLPTLALRFGRFGVRPALTE
jgi:hypothetical protein